jgi:hypothetical protein
MDGANSYLVNIILPSGETFSFTTDKTFRDRYMEAFPAGGEYKWQVTAQGADGKQICISGASTFNKPAYQKPSGSGGGDGGGLNGGNGSGGSSGGNGGGGCDPVSGCDGG